MIKAKKLKPRSTIGIISPSYWIDENILKKTSKIFSDKNYKLVYGKSIYAKDGPFAGSPKIRADDIHSMFTDPSIDAIICARGGYGANKVIPLLDYELIKKNPKIFLGYSDITSYLISITQRSELVTFHGPMLSSYKDGFVEYNFNQMINILSGKRDAQIIAPKTMEPHILKAGNAVGPLWGGNLTLMINRLGTNDAYDTTNAILFLEDLNEYYYSFERMLIHLQKAGMLDNISGLIIGELINIKDEDISFSKSTDEIVMDICGEMDFPIVTNFPCGHGSYQATLPISLPVELQAERTISIKLLESAVE
ncbi:MAG: LD-carboxypeptidase [Candidatus Marinimicrobia bacterium]|nr:LD-carboxypeptidase [Candidatus Neomarinimicrobiota bacterium]